MCIRVRVLPRSDFKWPRVHYNALDIYDKTFYSGVLSLQRNANYNLIHKAYNERINNIKSKKKIKKILGI